MKNPYSMPPSQYKGDASQFYGPIAYSVLFGVPLQDSESVGNYGDKAINYSHIRLSVSQ